MRKIEKVQSIISQLFDTFGIVYGFTIQENKLKFSVNTVNGVCGTLSTIDDECCLSVRKIAINLARTYAYKFYIEHDIPGDHNKYKQFVSLAENIVVSMGES